MKLWLILGKNLSTLLSGCDRLLPPVYYLYYMLYTYYKRYLYYLYY